MRYLYLDGRENSTYHVWGFSVLKYRVMRWIFIVGFLPRKNKKKANNPAVFVGFFANLHRHKFIPLKNENKIRRTHRPNFVFSN